MMKKRLIPGYSASPEVLYFTYKILVWLLTKTIKKEKVSNITNSMQILKVLLNRDLTLEVLTS